MKKNVSKLILCALVAVCVCLTFSCGNKDPLSDPYSYESLMQKPFAERYAFLGEKDIKDLPDTCPQTGWYSFYENDLKYCIRYFDKDTNKNAKEVIYIKSDIITSNKLTDYSYCHLEQDYLFSFYEMKDQGYGYNYISTDLYNKYKAILPVYLSQKPSDIPENLINTGNTGSL